MSFELHNAIGIDVMYIEHNCNIVQFLMNVPTMFICLSTSNIKGRVAIRLPIKHHFV